MKKTRLILLISIFLFMGVAGLALADETEKNSNASSGSTDQEPEIEIIVLEDGTEEIQELLPSSAHASSTLDERYLAIQRTSQEQIETLLEQIDSLADRNDEAAIQKQIEIIKLESEIQRLELLKTDAESREDFDLVDELAYELDHLKSIDEPSRGVPEEQQPQQATD